ncbi:sensor histidine kinase [Sulfitobacter aestuarii]|uniref:Sensor histidine kinase n=1 Tax=Sulfitobacter aestuarii TaxID=2161676 RepID=A0ABW5U378_9RHOB
MIAAPHPKEAERLRTLRSYDILDTPREEDFDEIVALASELCAAPISVINLIDDTRQWFKAEVGLGARETPVATSICSHVILDDGFVEIPDTLSDPRMADNPLCTAAEGLRFYAGVQLVAPNGLPIGTLCVLDNKPGHLDPLQRKALEVLSRQVMKQLELRLALKNQAILAREADHRVKNSLQTLSSVVRLYGRNLSDPQALEAFDAVLRRIDAVAALHSELQGTDQNGQVDAKAYLDRVIALLEQSAPDNIVIDGQFDNISLRANAAAALGFVISEFIANSIKHAFTDSETGRIDIRLAQKGAELHLDCQDNGKGSRDSPDGQAVPNLGSNLMAAAASQLDGTLENGLTAAGSRLSLRF